MGATAVSAVRTAERSATADTAVAHKPLDAGAAAFIYYPV
jgi:hypothetical protein